MSKLLSILFGKSKNKSKKQEQNPKFVKIFLDTPPEYVRGQLYIRGFKKVREFYEKYDSKYKLTLLAVFRTIQGHINHIHSIVALYEEGIDLTPRLTDRQLKRFKRLAREKGILV